MRTYFVFLTLAAAALAAPQNIQRTDEVIPTAATANEAPVAVHASATVAPGEPVGIISQTQELGLNGTYNFSFESADGTRREESGYLKYDVPQPSEGAPEEYDGTAQVAQGSYSYVADDGTIITIKYIADENGFRVEGDHLPQLPSVPPVSEQGRSEGQQTGFRTSGPTLSSATTLQPFNPTQTEAAGITEAAPINGEAGVTQDTTLGNGFNLAEGPQLSS